MLRHLVLLALVLATVGHLWLARQTTQMRHRLETTIANMQTQLEEVHALRQTWLELVDRAQMTHAQAQTMLEQARILRLQSLACEGL